MGRNRRGARNTRMVRNRPVPADSKPQVLGTEEHSPGALGTARSPGAPGIERSPVGTARHSEALGTEALDTENRLAILGTARSPVALDSCPRPGVLRCRLRLSTASIMQLPL